MDFEFLEVPFIFNQFVPNVPKNWDDRDKKDKNSAESLHFFYLSCTDFTIGYTVRFYNNWYNLILIYDKRPFIGTFGQYSSFNC
jgi:hypothetical protein